MLRRPSGNEAAFFVPTKALRRVYPERHLHPICSPALAAARLSACASVANRAFGGVQLGRRAQGDISISKEQS
jgi:hypothetical protein